MSQAHENPDRPHGFTIGEAARASGLTAKTIRYYEQVGLIPKARRRNSGSAPHTGGDRIYSEADIGRLSFVRHARLVDLSLADIRELLDDPGRCRRGDTTEGTGETNHRPGYAPPTPAYPPDQTQESWTGRWAGREEDQEIRVSVTANVHVPPGPSTK